jgi:hypothetical protein
VNRPTLFLALAGAALLAHRILCGLLRRALGDGSAADGALMSRPNRLFGSPRYQGFLLARFYFPWTALPPSADGLDPSTKAVLLAARLTGFLFLAAVVGFIVALLAELPA